MYARVYLTRPPRRVRRRKKTASLATGETGVRNNHNSVSEFDLRPRLQRALDDDRSEKEPPLRSTSIIVDDRTASYLPVLENNRVVRPLLARTRYRNAPPTRNETIFFFGLDFGMFPP